jgi:hypothetical protein
MTTDQQPIEEETVPTGDMERARARLRKIADLAVTFMDAENLNFLAQYLETWVRASIKLRLSPDQARTEAQLQRPIVRPRGRLIIRKRPKPAPPARTSPQE